MSSDVTTLAAFYDLAVGPVSFDFVTFMVKAKMEQARVGAPRLHVAIVPKVDGVGGMFRDKRPFFDEHEARWRLWNIVVPAAQLFGATVTLATDWTQAKRLAAEKGWACWPPDWDRQTLKDRRHLVGDIITLARAGKGVLGPDASPHARRKVREWYKRTGKGCPVVTMTYRQTYLPERNSDPKVWREVRWHVASRGYAVVEMHDTDHALSKGSGYGELNLDLRMACYQEAALNLQANNGAASLCWFSKAPYVMFGAGVPPEEWDGLFVKQGLPLGETWPWAAPNQRLAYGPTTVKQVCEEFDRWASGTN